MADNISTEAMPTALVLSWNATITRVLCPYKCELAIHRHTTILPLTGDIQIQVSHCDDPNRPLKQYRVLYPFQDHGETKNMWWLKDVAICGFRTVSMNIFDPDYREAGEGVSGDVGFQLDLSDTDRSEASMDQPSDDLEKKMSQLNLTADESIQIAPKSPEVPTKSPETRSRSQEEILFIGFCLTNDHEAVDRMLKEVSVEPSLAAFVLPGSKKSILQVACEEGHVQTVDVLLKNGADLQHTDGAGSTALGCAFQYGHFEVANRLIDAGAVEGMFSKQRTEYINQIKLAITTRENRLSDFKRVLGRQTHYEQGRMRQKKMFYGNRTSVTEPTNPCTPIKVGKGSEPALKRELVGLKTILKRLDQDEHKFRSRFIPKRNSSNQCQAATAYFSPAELDSNISRRALIAEEISNVELDGPWRTVACLSRGNILPDIFAISGWRDGIYRGNKDTLRRSFWLDRVFNLAKLVGHTLEPHQSYDGARPGSWHACHAEKQLLAFFISTHTSTDLQRDGDENEKNTMNCSPPSLAKLQANIFVSQPWKEERAEICEDCWQFCEKVVMYFKLSIRLWLITAGKEPDYYTSLQNIGCQLVKRGRFPRQNSKLDTV